MKIDLKSHDMLTLGLKAYCP